MLLLNGRLYLDFKSFINQKYQPKLVFTIHNIRRKIMKIYCKIDLIIRIVDGVE